jgi:hypothetical protein
MWPFKPKQKDLEFVDMSKITYPRFPVLRAKDVKPLCYEMQKAKYGKVTFPQCPGMIDYSQIGYIIPAWTDIHIMANKAGVCSAIGTPERGNRDFEIAKRMDKTIVDGYINSKEVDQVPLHFGGPWKLFTPHNMSALILPATFHSSFLDDLVVWPGVVDFNKFHTINFIASAKRECNIIIKAGEPLLQVIPFINQEFNAGYGPPTLEQEHIACNEIPGNDTHYYRKFYMSIKKYLLSEKNT